MKNDIHPDYHLITVVKTNGEKYQVMSTYGKEGDELHMDIGPENHPAWTGSRSFVNEKAGRVAEFNKKFGGLKFGSKSSSADAAEEDTNAS